MRPKPGAGERGSRPVLVVTAREGLLDLPGLLGSTMYPPSHITVHWFAADTPRCLKTVARMSPRHRKLIL